MRPRVPVWAVVLMLALAAVQGLYAAWLHRLYYSLYAPFFDSMAYTDFQAALLGQARTGSFVDTFQLAVKGTTVSLPWLMMLPVAQWLPVSRLLGVWIQEFWLAALAVSVLIYFRVYRKAPLGLAILWTIPVIFFDATFRYNGGVSDFRMDLLLYVMFSLTAVWYLATRETDSRLPWLLSGLSLMLCCFSRATAPAYLGFAFAPALIGRWLRSPGERLHLARRVAIYWAPAALVGVLPVINNWTYIHYYYFVWGAAPTAHLPLIETLGHAYYARMNMGVGLSQAAAALFVVHLTAKRFDFDWELAWLAFAPVGVLMATGAGMNPFAAMSAVFGTTLFCLAPFRGGLDTRRPVYWLSALLVVICASYARMSYRDHLGPQDGNRPSMAALRAGIDRMRDESRRLGWERAEFTTSHLMDFGATTLRNVLRYEYGASPSGAGFRLSDGLTLATSYEGPFSAAVPVNWSELPGSTEEEKFQYLVSLANRSVNFFFLPDEKSIGFLERYIRHNYINLKIRELKRRLLATEVWRQVGEPIRTTNHEAVELYVNTGLSSR